MHLKKFKYRENVFFFLLISKSETFIYSRFMTCKVKHFNFILGDLCLQLMRVKNPVSSKNIRIFIFEFH